MNPTLLPKSTRYPKRPTIVEIFADGTLLNAATGDGGQRTPSPLQGMHQQPQQMIRFDNASWQSWSTSFKQQLQIVKVIVTGGRGYNGSTPGGPRTNVLLNGQTILSFSDNVDLQVKEWAGSLTASSIVINDASGGRFRLHGLEIYAEVS